MTNCKNCNKETNNPKFCSKSCSASYNNRKFPKRKRKKRYCKHCGKDITQPQDKPAVVTVCDDCNNNIVNWSVVTIGECRNKRTYQFSSRIRDLSKRWYNKSSRPKYCEICGYDKHYEVCHIKPVSAFSDDTTITEVNSLNNLIALCRNHHWEFDNGLLII